MVNKILGLNPGIDLGLFTSKGNLMQQVIPITKLLLTIIKNLDNPRMIIWISLYNGKVNLSSWACYNLLSNEIQIPITSKSINKYKIRIELSYGN